MIALLARLLLPGKERHDVLRIESDEHWQRTKRVLFRLAILVVMLLVIVLLMIRP
jgi:hypothetical protein